MLGRRAHISDAPLAVVAAAEDVSDVPGAFDGMCRLHDGVMPDFQKIRTDSDVPVNGDLL